MLNLFNVQNFHIHSGNCCMYILPFGYSASQHKNRPGFLLRKPGRSFALFVLFQALTQNLAGVLVAAWAGAKITGRSESHISTYIRFYSYVSSYVVVSFQPHCYSIKTRIHRSLIYIALIKHIPNVPFNRLV